MSRTNKLSLKVILALLVVSFIVAAIYLMSTEEVYRVSSPSREYIAVISRHRYERFKMRMPGDGSSFPVFVEVIDNKGISFGRIPVPTIMHARELLWTSSGAEIKLVGEWNFNQHTCHYWSKNQDKQIWVRR